MLLTFATIRAFRGHSAESETTSASMPYLLHSSTSCG